RVLIYQYYYILSLNLLKSKDSTFIFFLNLFNKVFIFIKILFGTILKIFMLLKYLKIIYQAFVDAFIDIYLLYLIDLKFFLCFLFLFILILILLLMIYII